MMNRKYLLFDIGKVLVDFDFNVLFGRIAADSGRPVGSPTGRDEQMHHAVERGTISDQEFVDYLNESHGICWTVETLIRVWQEMFTINETGYGLFRKMIERGQRVYTLSNISEHHMKALERNWPGFFEGATGLFLSYKIGARKPDAEIYQHVLNELGARGRQCLFVDDLPENVEAARVAGIQTHQFIPENHTAIHEEINRFVELA